MISRDQDKPGSPWKDRPNPEIFENMDLDKEVLYCVWQWLEDKKLLPQTNLSLDNFCILCGRLKVHGKKRKNWCCSQSHPNNKPTFSWTCQDCLDE